MPYDGRAPAVPSNSYGNPGYAPRVPLPGSSAGGYPAASSSGGSTLPPWWPPAAASGSGGSYATAVPQETAGPGGVESGYGYGYGEGYAYGYGGPPDPWAAVPNLTRTSSIPSLEDETPCVLSPSASSGCLPSPSSSWSSQGAQTPAWVPAAVTEAPAERLGFNDAYCKAESAIRDHWGRLIGYEEMKSTYSAARSVASTSEDKARLVDLLKRQKKYIQQEDGSKGSYDRTLVYGSVVRDKREREARDGMFSWISAQREELTGRVRRSVGSRLKGFAKAFHLPGKSRRGG
jgi:hypothetical protein